MKTRFVRFLPSEIKTAENQTEFFQNLKGLLDNISPYWMIGDSKYIDSEYYDVFLSEYEKRKEEVENVCHLIGKDVGEIDDSWNKSFISPDYKITLIDD